MIHSTGQLLDLLDPNDLDLHLSESRLVRPRPCGLSLESHLGRRSRCHFSAPACTAPTPAIPAPSPRDHLPLRAPHLHTARTRTTQQHFATGFALPPPGVLHASIPLSGTFSPAQFPHDPSPSLPALQPQGLYFLLSPTIPADWLFFFSH